MIKKCCYCGVINPIYDDLVKINGGKFTCLECNYRGGVNNGKD